MIYEFLKDFNKRIEIVAVIHYITSRVSKKYRLKELNFENNEAINLIMLVLCFIMEKSLVEEICTKQDISEYIRKLDIEYFKKKISDDEYINIADIVIKDCLQNLGMPYYFTTFNFETNSEEKINVKVIDDKRVSYGNEYVYSYYMTPQGYKFLFNTLEIEESLKVSIEQFKLSLSIKKRNFNVAKNNVDNLFNLSKTQIQKINYFIKKIKEDIASTGIKEYENIYNSTFKSINEQNEGYSELYELINKVEKTIMDNSEKRLDKKAFQEEVDNIIYIKKKLKFIINEQSSLLLKQQELQKIYSSAVDNILNIGFENRFCFDELVAKKLEENPNLAYSVIKILRPLFQPDLEKIFNINKAVKEQKIIDTEVEESGSNILMNQRYFNNFESEKDIRIKTLTKQYIGILKIILDYIFKEDKLELNLSQLLLNLNSNYNDFVPDLKVLTNVLIQLTSLKEVDFNVIKKQNKQTVFSPTEEFDVKYSVISLLEDNEKIKKISKFKIKILREKFVFIPERIEKGNDEFIVSDKVKGLNCPDILFKIEVE